MEMVEGSVDLDDFESASIVVKHGAGKLELTGDRRTRKTGLWFICLLASMPRSQKRGQNSEMRFLQPQHYSFPDVSFLGNWIGGKRTLMGIWFYPMNCPWDLAPSRCR